MVSLEITSYNNYMEGYIVSKRTENRLVERIADVMLSDIVMDNEETTISMNEILSIFAGIGGLGWKLSEERQLDYPPTEKARSVATYARMVCRQAFPNLNKGEADKMASALLALLAWLVDHLPKASDTELAMHLFGQASHISPKYFAEHLPYTLLKPYENIAGEMAMWLLNGAMKAETPPEQKTATLIGIEAYVEKAMETRDEDALETYKKSLMEMLAAEENSCIRELLQKVKACLNEIARPAPTILYKSSYNAHVENQYNTGLSSQQPTYQPSATA